MRQALHVLCVGFLLFSLAACSASTSPKPSNAGPSPTSTLVLRPQPTPTTFPAGTVLYQADWSHGLSGWQGKGWKVIQGQLETESSDPATITVPYRLTVTNYAIEVRIQIVRLLQKNGGYFSIFATKAAGKDGYQAGVSDLKEPNSGPFGSHPQAQVFIDPYDSAGSGLPMDYEPGFQWHTYRVEVQDNEARLLVNDVQIGHASSNQTDMLSNGPLGLISALLVLRVSSLRIVAL